MTSTRSLFAVVVPLFNRAGTIEAAIESVAADISDPVDMVIVDDGSTDNGAEVAEAAFVRFASLRGRVIRQKNGGPGRARNTGIAACNSDYVAFLDSDDCWAPGTTDLLQNLLSTADMPDMVFLATRDLPSASPSALPPVAAQGVQIERFDRFSKLAVAGIPSRLASCNVILSRALLDRTGGFRTDMMCSEDTDLFLRADDWPCALVTRPEIVAHAVGTDSQLTGDITKVKEGLGKMLQAGRRADYPPSPEVSEVLANSVVHTIRKCFSGGHIKAAYGLYAREFIRLLRAGRWHWMIRLPLMPALHAIKPEQFAFRWTSAGGSSGGSADRST